MEVAVNMLFSLVNHIFTLITRGVYVPPAKRALRNVTFSKATNTLAVTILDTFQASFVKQEASASLRQDDHANDFQRTCFKATQPLPLKCLAASGRERSFLMFNFLQPEMIHISTKYYI